MSGAGRRRLGPGELAVVGVLAAVAAVGGTTGRLFVAGLVVLGVLSRLHAPGDPAACRSRPSLLGSALAGIGLTALVLSRVDLAALVVVAFAVDLVVGRWRLAQVQIGASTARHAVAGEMIDVDVRIRGVRGQVTVTLLDPPSPPVGVSHDGECRIPHLAEHRGIYDLVRLEVRSAGWLATVVTSRVDAVVLDGPITVHPRAVPVEVAVEPEPADGGPGGGPTGRGWEASEVRSLRPYRSGDPRRRVHWPTTARRGELAVVEVDGEANPAVELVVELPGLPCDRRHDGSHQQHLDLVTGQARYTAERLFAAGVPVVLTTVESDPHGQPRTVTATVRSHTELGHRLAAAREPRTAAGDPLLSPDAVTAVGSSPSLDALAARPARSATGPHGARWYVGPDAGPARRATTTERLAEGATAASPQDERDDLDSDLEEARRCTGPAPLDPRGGLDAPAHEVGATVWVASLAGVFTALVLGEARLPGPVLAALTVAAVAIGMLRWRGSASPEHAVTTVLFAVVAAIAAVGLAGPGVLVVAVASAWALPRVVGMDLLERSALRSDDRVRPADPWRVTTSLCAAAVVLMSTTAWTNNWSVAVPVALLAGTVALVGLRRRWWPHLVVALAITGMVAAATVIVPVWAMLATVAALTATFVARVGATGPATDLEGTGRPFLPARLLGRVVVVGALVVLIVPLLGWGAEQVADGLGADGSTVREGASEGFLGWNDQLDLTAPRPDRERVVLLVEADLPALLRDSSYEEWDGRSWWSGLPDVDRVIDGGTEAVRVVTQRDVGSVSAGAELDPVVSRQRITVRADGAQVLPAAAEPVEVTADALVIALADGNLRVPAGLRRGDTYEVTSRVPSATDEELRAASALPVPPSIQERFAPRPALSARARADIRSVAGDLPTVYDQVRALEAWLGDQVEYSLDAPLPPAGVDVVDHFLYDTRAGWCQQVATTLTLALRELGVPARLVTGYVASEWDGRRFVVRERDAHAWVEVYFPGVGWYGFDPTAVVPLAADAEPPSGPGTADPTLLAAAAGILAVTLAVWALWLRRRRGGGDTSRDDAPHDPRPWASAADRRIRALGERCGIERSVGGGVVEQADRLAEVLGDDRIRLVAQVVQRDAYGREGATQEERHAAEQILDDAAIAATDLVAARTSAGGVDGPPPPPDVDGRADITPRPPARR